MYKPFDINHPPAIGAVCNDSQGSYMIVGWFISSDEQIFINVGGYDYAISAESFFKQYTVEGHPAGYEEN